MQPLQETGDGVAVGEMAADVVGLSSAPTIEGSDVAVSVQDGNVFINDARVIITDIVTDNGVIHVIDAVLIP